MPGDQPSAEGECREEGQAHRKVCHHEHDAGDARPQCRDLPDQARVTRGHRQHCDAQKAPGRPLDESHSQQGLHSARRTYAWVTAKRGTSRASAAGPDHPTMALSAGVAGRSSASAIVLSMVARTTQDKNASRRPTAATPKASAVEATAAGSEDKTKRAGLGVCSANHGCRDI